MSVPTSSKTRADRVAEFIKTTHRQMRDAFDWIDRRDAERPYSRLVEAVWELTTGIAADMDQADTTTNPDLLKRAVAVYWLLSDERACEFAPRLCEAQSLPWEEDRKALDLAFMDEQDNPVRRTIEGDAYKQDQALLDQHVASARAAYESRRAVRDQFDKLDAWNLIRAYTDSYLNDGAGCNLDVRTPTNNVPAFENSSQKGSAPLPPATWTLFEKAEMRGILGMVSDQREWGNWLEVNMNWLKPAGKAKSISSANKLHVNLSGLSEGDASLLVALMKKRLKTTTPNL